MVTPRTDSYAIALGASLYAGDAVPAPAPPPPAPPPPPPPPPPPAAPALTLVAGAASATVGVAATGWRVDNTGSVPATASISVPGELGSNFTNGQTIAAGASVAFTLTALVAGARSVALSSSTPGAVISGSPGTFTGVSAPPPPPPPPPPAPPPGAAPTLITQSAPADWTTNTPVPVTYTLDAPADRAYVVTPSLTGAAIEGETSKTIAIGQRSVTFAVRKYAEGDLQVDFNVSPSLTRAGRPATVHCLVQPKVDIVEEELNLARLVWVEPWLYGGGSYMRYQVLIKWDPSTTSIRMLRGDISGAVTPVQFRPAKTYTLLVDGVELASAAAAEGAGAVNFTFTTTSVASGWRRLTIGNLSDGETCPSLWVLMKRPGDPKPKRVPAALSSYDVEQRPWDHRHAWCFVPAAYAPKPAPLAPRTWPHFSNAETANLRAVPLTLVGHGPLHLPNVDSAGDVSTFNMQAYFWDDFIQKWPRTILLDGPRGVGTLAMCAHISLATATVRSAAGSPRTGHYYALDPWRFCRLGVDGSIKTLAGFRHRPVASYWGEAPKFSSAPNLQPTLELVGDWSAIPEERHGFHELWGMVWLPSTVEVDPALPLVDDDGVLREQHPVGPSALLTDTQNNRVARVTFHPTDRTRDATVTEWLTGLGDPWGIAQWFNPATEQYEILVSERTNNRIRAYTEEGVLIRTVVERNPLLPGTITLDGLRKAIISGSLTEARAQPCLGPEDLVVMDNWLYWGSYAQRQVRRVDLVTGVVEVFCDLDPHLDGNSAYVKIAVSDGTFGPRHTVFVASWAVTTPPLLGGFLPGGGRWNLIAGIGAMDAQGYGAAVAVGDGRMVFGISDYGVWEIRQAPRANDALFGAGLSEFKRMYGKLRFGDGGFGTFGQELPWNQSDALNYYLTEMGHTPPPDLIRAPTRSVPATLRTAGDSMEEHFFRSTPTYWSQGLLGAPLELIANCGFSGQSIVGLVSQLDNDYRASPPGWAGLPTGGWGELTIGMNFYRGAEEIFSIGADNQGHFRNIVAKALTYVDEVIVRALPPVGGAGGRARSPQVQVWNEFMKRVVAEDTTGRVHWIDDTRDLVDARGNIDPSCYMVDEYHTDRDGPRRMAVASRWQRAELLKHQGYPRAPLVTNPADVYPAQPQWVNNPTMSGTGGFLGGGWTGQCPAGWGVSTNGSGIGGTVAIVPAAAEDPNQTPWLEVTPTTCAWASLWITPAVSGRAITAIDPGTTEQLLEVRFTNLRNFEQLETFLSNNAGAKFTQPAYLKLDANSPGGVSGTVVLRQKFYRFGSTAGGTPQGYITLQGVNNASGPMGKVAFRNMSVRG